MHDAILRLVWKIVIISIGCIAAGIVCIVLLTRFSTKPLKKLSQITGSIANGEYGKRAIITKDEIGMLARDFNVMADAIQVRIGELNETAERQRLFIGGLTHGIQNADDVYHHVFRDTSLCQTFRKRHAERAFLYPRAMQMAGAAYTKALEDDNVEGDGLT